jgi:hypothetical protein
VQETPEALLARCAEILGLAPGQDGASQPQPSWDVDLASLEEEEHDNADKVPEYVPPPPKLPKPISPESSSIPHSPISSTPARAGTKRSRSSSSGASNVKRSRLNHHDQIQQFPDGDDSGVFLNDHDQTEQTLDYDDSEVFLNDHGKAGPARAQYDQSYNTQAQQPSIPQLGKVNTEIISFELLQEVMRSGYTIIDGNDLLFDHRIAPVPLVVRVLPFLCASG